MRERLCYFYRRDLASSNVCIVEDYPMAQFKEVAMSTVLQHVGTFFLGAAVVVFLLFSLLSAKSGETGVLEQILILGFTAIPAALAVLAFMAASQMA